MSDGNRRDFLKRAAAAGVGLSVLRSGRAASGEMPYRPLGTTGERVSLVCLGGAHIGYSDTSEDEAVRIMHAAIDGGVNFFDNSWDYNRGVSEERMGKALAMDGKRRRVFLMTKFCCHREGWTKDAALRMLDESLQRLGTDYLDLWQIHEVISPDHPDLAFRSGSAVEAMVAAREAGKVRYVGFTGHRDPAIHLEMLSHDFPFDAVQLPLNVLDSHYRSFERHVLPVLVERGIGVIGMKPLGGGGRRGAIPETGVVSALECLRYAMSLPVSTVCTGITSEEVLRQALEAARTFRPLGAEERRALLERTREVAHSGEHERYKLS
jgi:predicted aldo/keto reductase-like oxidoreductase